MPADPVSALILAAGEGTRLTSPTPKVLLEISGKTVLEWSVAAFAATPEIDAIVVVAHPDLVPTVASLLQDARKVEAITPGGATRSASARAGLEALPHDHGIVLVHDAARPLVTRRVVSELVARLSHAEAATIAVPARDTILRVADDRIVKVPDRTGLWHAQTPQGFRLATLRAAYAAAGGGTPDFPDDCSLVLHHRPDADIRVVPGPDQNLKITTLGDVAVAEAILDSRRQPGRGSE